MTDCHQISDAKHTYIHTSLHCTRFLSTNNLHQRRRMQLSLVSLCCTKWPPSERRFYAMLQMDCLGGKILFVFFCDAGCEVFRGCFLFGLQVGTGSTAYFLRDIFCLLSGITEQHFWMEQDCAACAMNFYSSQPINCAKLKL